MAQAARDISASVVSSSELQLRIFTSSFAIGASGAVDSTIAGYRVAPGCTLANTGTGTFSLVYPVCPNVQIQCNLVSAAATVTECVLTAKSATAGTATIRTSKAGLATNPASGDIVEICVLALPMGQAN